jgi:N-acetylmuramoyl-L-alanine amidase
MPALVAIAALVAACAGSGVGVGTTTSAADQAPTSSIGNGATTTMQAITTTTGAFDDAAVGALITPSGVIVAVIEKVATGYLVRTPCGDTATISGGEPVGPVRVVLDPGHGGEVDSGAVGSNGLREADLNLTVAQATQQELEARGIPTLLTRTKDYATRIGTRAQLADHLGAEILVSIHHNAPTPGASTSPGTEIFIQSDSERSRRLGGLIWEHVVDGLTDIDGIQWSAAPDAGVLRVLNPEGEDAYGMVRLPETVSVLSELAYISSSAEAEMLATDEYVEIAAASVGDAIETYFEETDLGSGYVLEPRVFRPQRGISEDACEDPDLG